MQNADSGASGRWREERRRTERGRGWRIVRAIAIGAFVAAFVAAGTVFGTLYWGSKEFREAFTQHFGENPLKVWTPERQFPGMQSVNILLLGVDRDLDNRRRPMKTNGRSDAILIARVDFANGTINALTIPRDTAVSIPGRRGLHKINAAHSFGGPMLAAETIQSAFGINTDAFVSINFDGFCDVVDAIGGVDINVEKRLKYDDNWGGLHVDLQPGYQHLNGYKAMGYVRMRHSDNDEMRSKRQHAFLESVRTKLKTWDTFKRLPGAVDQLADSLKRSPNLTKDQMYALLNFARSLPREKIQVETLPSIEGRSYVSVKRSEAQEMIRRMFFPERTTEVMLDVPSPDTVASMNGEGRRASSRRSSGEASERSTETSTNDDGAASDTPESSGEGEPTGDGLGAGETDGSAESGESQYGGDGMAPPLPG